MILLCVPRSQRRQHPEARVSLPLQEATDRSQQKLALTYTSPEERGSAPHKLCDLPLSLSFP